eukprot:273657_1
MDDSFPIILSNREEVRKGNIKELTISALERETQRLFRDEFTQCTAKYMADDATLVTLDDDDDLETEWGVLNPESSDEDSDDDDSDNENEDKQTKALRILVFFKIKKMEIQCPQPVEVRVTNIKSTTAVFEWRIARHTLTKTQMSALQFEIQQLSSKTVTKCNVIVDHNGLYQIKLSGLCAMTPYKFVRRSLLCTNHNAIFSDTCEPFEFETSKDLLTQPNDIPRDIPAPTDLQVIALYPNRVTLAWNHTAIEHLKHYDFEYYIEERDVFTGDCAATEDGNLIEIMSLYPSTQYTFVCKAKYYDPERKLSDAYYVNDALISSPTNAVTITTPQMNTNRNDYRTRSIDKVRWVKRGNELELFWSAPESFVGKIEYELRDKMQGNMLLGTANKLPVTISTGDRGHSIFENPSGQYVITVKPIFVADNDEKMERVEGKPYDIQIAIDDEKRDASSESMLELSVSFPQKNSKRSVKIDTTTCDLNRFTVRLCEQFQLSAQEQLKLSVRIRPNQIMKIDSETSWQSFINNHSESFIHANKKCPCEIATVMDAPGHVEVRVNESLDQFEIDFKSEDVDRYYGQVEARDPKSNALVDLGVACSFVKGTRIPLIYHVKGAFRYCVFRFKIKCGNRYSDSAYSAWTEWTQFSTPHAQLNSPLQSPLHSLPESTVSVHSPPLQQYQSSSPLHQSTTMPSSPLQPGGSAANNYNGPSESYDYGPSGGSGNDNLNNASQFRYPKPEQSNEAIKESSGNENVQKVSTSSLNELPDDVPGGDTNTFFANFGI